MMAEELLSDFLRHLDRFGSMEIGTAPENIQKWLPTTGLPDFMVRLLMHNWPQVDSQVDHLVLFSSQRIHDFEATNPLIEQGLFIIGAGRSGDLVVVDFRSSACVPGFVSCEEWWPPADNARNFFQPIARSFESLLFRIIEGRYIPLDWYSAGFFNAFLKEERESYGPINPPSTPRG
ncbi:MAG: hypothetical protein LLG01_15340 [Planctomycetaceae bacterium]|nr:hypothetical protein [Planctomycetaceae bacterium]